MRRPRAPERSFAGGFFTGPSYGVSTIETVSAARTRALVALFAAVVGMTLAIASPAGAAQPKISPYKGFGTWIDIFDKPAFQKPKEVVAAIVARGVKTIYLETSNYSQDAAIVRPAATGKLLEAAHAAGLDVVAWYLPSFTRVKRDLTRSLAAIAFRSANGQAFDSFALDIESALVPSPGLRNTRLLTVSRGIRSAVGGTYPLGAIIPSPRGMQLSPTYWPAFPYSELAGIYDVILPMSYYTYRVKGGTAVRRYTMKSIAIIRAETRKPQIPIHMIGGVASSTSPAEARGFMKAIAACHPYGYSLYDYYTTSAAAWTALRDVPATGGACS